VRLQHCVSIVPDDAYRELWRVELDGKGLEGVLLPPLDDGAAHEVTVHLTQG